MKRDDLHRTLNQWLNTSAIDDYCPNGLQVEGRKEVTKIITGVTACQALLDAAVERQADAILVHHGYFWKGEPAVVTGMKQRRLTTLLTNQINLFAYHLPLDVHPQFGNNAELATRLNLSKVEAIRSVSPVGVVMQGELSDALTADAFKASLQAVVGRTLVAAVTSEREIKRVALCTGGGQGFIEAAFNAGADAFVSGEISEQTVHVAREYGIQFFAAGHHATERYGIKALGEKLAAEFALDVEFIDIDSPA